jgi:hypothetical protein
MPHQFFLLFQSHQSRRFRVSEHGAATEYYTAYFDQNFAKRRVRDQANSLRSIVQRARRPENPSKEAAVRNAHPKNKPRRHALISGEHQMQMYVPRLTLLSKYSEKEAKCL